MQQNGYEPGELHAAFVVCCAGCGANLIMLVQTVMVARERLTGWGWVQRDHGVGWTCPRCFDRQAQGEKL